MEFFRRSALLKAMSGEPLMEIMMYMTHQAIWHCASSSQFSFLLYLIFLQTVPALQCYQGKKIWLVHVYILFIRIALNIRDILIQLKSHTKDIFLYFTTCHSWLIYVNTNDCYEHLWLISFMWSYAIFFCSIFTKCFSIFHKRTVCHV